MGLFYNAIFVLMMAPSVILCADMPSDELMSLARLVKSLESVWKDVKAILDKRPVQILALDTYIYVESLIDDFVANVTFENSTLGQISKKKLFGTCVRLDDTLTSAVSLTEMRKIMKGLTISLSMFVDYALVFRENLLFSLTKISNPLHRILLFGPFLWQKIKVALGSPQLKGLTAELTEFWNFFMDGVSVYKWLPGGLAGVFSPTVDSNNPSTKKCYKYYAILDKLTKLEAYSKLKIKTWRFINHDLRIILSFIRRLRQPVRQISATIKTLIVQIYATIYGTRYRSHFEELGQTNYC